MLIISPPKVNFAQMKPWRGQNSNSSLVIILYAIAHRPLDPWTPRPLSKNKDGTRTGGRRTRHVAGTWPRRDGHRKIDALS